MCLLPYSNTSDATSACSCMFVHVHACSCMLVCASKFVPFILLNVNILFVENTAEVTGTLI